MGGKAVVFALHPDKKINAITEACDKYVRRIQIPYLLENQDSSLLCLEGDARRFKPRFTAVLSTDLVRLSFWKSR
jgi:hypothetical protein